MIKIALLILSFSASVLAAQIDRNDSSSTADSARSHKLDTIAIHEKANANAKQGYAVQKISSATRTNVLLRDVPQSVTVLSRELLSDQSAQSMSEIARFIPGVTFSQGEGHRDAPTIRGNSSTADFFLDGIRDDAQYLRDIYNIERVEALKGSNGMTFGRGGGGGVINRVSKIADWRTNRSVTLEGGSFGHRRTTLDIGDALSSRFSGRVNAVAENSGSFRDATSLARRGINPTTTLIAGNRVIRFAYEYFVDRRTVNRGIPSFNGRPSAAPTSQFFGDPDASRSSLRANNVNLSVESDLSNRVSFRSRTQLSSYDKLYQNVLPGAVTSDGRQVTLTGYRNRHDRSNLFSQNDLIFSSLGTRIRHTLLVGSELGRQRTRNFRETGFFGTATSLRVPFSSPMIASGVEFRQSSSDADNDVGGSVAAAYAQEQISVGRRWQAILGARQERFEMDFRNHRTSQALGRTDVMTSPRAGLIFKPIEEVSIYGSVGVSHLPSAGDQFSSLTATTETLKPEKFLNREVGLKWDVLPALSFSSAVYSLSRSNTSAPDPTDPVRVVQTGRQHSSGFEANIAGDVTAKLQVFGGFASQRAQIINRTLSSIAGASVPMVPSKSASLWTRYDFSSAVGIALGGIAQKKMFAAIDNTVTLPGFARADGALFIAPARNLRAQVNVENIFNTRYFANSQGNNNIMPGAPRTLRVSVSVR